MKKRSLGAALAVAGSFAAGCSEPLNAQDEKPPAPPAPAPPPKPDEPVTPLPQRPIDDGAIRALAEEVARLRAELAEQKKRAAETPAPFGRVPSGGAPETGRSEPVFGTDEPAPAVVEREVPVYVDREVVVEREVPVYVDREVVVQRPTVVLERVVYQSDQCEQWIPYGHVHSIGCGHHYYGCTCHPWYYSLASRSSLSFSFVHVDRNVDVNVHRDRDRDHRDGDRDGHRGSRDDGRSDGRDHDRRGPQADGTSGRGTPDRPGTVIVPGRTPRDGDRDDGRVLETRPPRETPPAVVQPGRAPQREREVARDREAPQRQIDRTPERQRRDDSAGRHPQRDTGQAVQRRSPPPPARPAPPPPPRQQKGHKKGG